jgi:hypothetical protein
LCYALRSTRFRNAFVKLLRINRSWHCSNLVRTSIAE